MKKLRDFNLRAENEKAWMIQNTWCDHCNLADLGLTEPIEFEKDGKIYLEGKCAKCFEIVLTEIEENYL